MPVKTPVIKYNLRDRGRKYTGKARDFDIRAICDVINGPKCQERVKNRDLLGYRGHWPRMAFGLRPTEGGVKQGKIVDLEAALVTTMLKAYPDGTIEHQAEFLDTLPGQIAARMYASRVGGFSSAISEEIPEFFGFDYVNEPNYTENRGFTLDSVMDGSVTLDSVGVTFDDVLAEINRENSKGIVLLLDSATNAYDQALQTIDRMQVENDQLVSMLAEKGIRATLDDTGQLPLVMPSMRAGQLLMDAAEFRSARLTPLAPLDDDGEEESRRAYERTASKYLKG